MLVRILVLLFRLSYRHSRGFNPVGIREFGPGLRRGAVAYTTRCSLLHLQRNKMP